MLELLETPTFVVDDFFDSKNIKLFDYLEFEKIPFEVLELCSAELPYRQGAYYPVMINDLHEDYNLFEKVNPRALEMAQDKKLIIVFLYPGYKNIIFSLQDTLVAQLVSHNVDFDDVRIVSEVSPLTLTPAYIHFSFAEVDAYLDAHETEYVDAFCDTPRERVFTCNATKDLPHARLFCASIWYHALADRSYINYPEQTTGTEIIDSEVYKWCKYWQSPNTLMDMLGQQLPFSNKPGYDLDFYNNAYWYFSIQDAFEARDLSLNVDTFKPIVNMQPFVIVGAPGSCGMLETLGYKTFKHQVNETYDDILLDEERMQSLFRLVYEMSHFTSAELNDLNDKLRSILIHNQTHFLSSKRHRLLTLLNSLKGTGF